MSDAERGVVDLSLLYGMAGRRALVTGATRGIGLAIARALGKAGAAVVVSSESSTDCESAADQLRNEGIDAHGIACDLSDYTQVARLAKDAEQAIGPLDVLVCNAGVPGPVGPIGLAGDSDWDAVMTVNLRSALWLSNLVIPGMAVRGGGSVMMTASLSALRGNKSIGLYGLSKAGLLQLVRNLAVEWGPSNVRVNALSPGVIQTEFSRPIVENEELSAKRIGLTPLRRFGTPEEVAGIALMLAAPAGAFITGQNIIIDGGTMISDGN